jgi:hypothetical protein
MCGQKTTNRQRIVEIIDKYNKTATYDNYLYCYKYQQ